jgi:hypothetical protein
MIVGVNGIQATGYCLVKKQYKHGKISFVNQLVIKWKSRCGVVNGQKSHLQFVGFLRTFALPVSHKGRLHAVEGYPS